MENAKPSHLSLMHYHLLLLLLLTAQASFIHSIDEVKKLPLDLQKLQWKQQQQETPPPSSGCIFQKPRVEKGATILEMKERDYCSGKTANNEKRLIQDELHVKSLQSTLSKTAKTNQISESQIPLTSGTRLQTLNYIVTVGIGTRNMTLIVDTGSDLTWVQCQPCRLCYNQQEPLYNPSSSSSYLSVLCNSTTCLALESATGNSGVCGNGNSGDSNPQLCNYVISYGDGSYSHGELGFEKLGLGKTMVENFIFGCGRNNKGLFGGVSGLMGLARSELSLVSQTYSLFGGIFSYCLPSTGIGSSGSLIMGGGDFSIFKNNSPISYTRMIPNPQMSNFYFLNVTGISVGGVDLVVPSLASNGVLNLIDSGTVISRLNPSIYRALKEEFLKQFSGFQTAPGFSLLNTCFNLSGYQEVNIPTIKFHFEGNAELAVDVEGIFYFVKSDASQICLAFASLSYEDEIGIIGNYQQKNQRVVYNSKESKVGFAGESCSF